MKKEDTLAKILGSAGKAHHQAFIEVDGHDPEWPQWYAQFLLSETKFSHYVPKVDESTLAHLLEMLDHQYKSESPKQRWPHYYASKLLKIG